MPSIRISNGQLFDPWKPEEYSKRPNALADNFSWLGHHLANECRYAGGCKWFYSVAQHSVLASRYVQSQDNGIDSYKKLKLAALLHDATEAVLKDIPGPFKKTATFSKTSSIGESYKTVEFRLMEWIYKQFGLSERYLNAPPIKAIDKELLDAERHILFPAGGYAYSGTIRIEPWDREYARDEFNWTLRDLTR